ncbi:MAG: hypothetical protein LBI03_07775 [Clostridiales bacterium]|jgi:hypothetical protein|nr:hypothetical protein [Clostridiales bacterium]
MREQKTISMYQEQKKIRPKIEDLISDIITDDEMKKNALDFVVHMRKNKMSLGWGDGQIVGKLLVKESLNNGLCKWE